MRFVASGPDIPVEVLTAQQDGTLIFFCGAGISMPAGLPSFSRLVDGLISDLFLGKKPLDSVGLTEIQEALSSNRQLKTAYNNKEYDHFIGVLCKQFSRSVIVESVKRYLEPSESVDLTPHQNIIKLGTDSNYVCRIITTNFDHLFELAEPSIPVRIAPALPVPKPERLKGIIHIHGAIHDKNDPDGDELVLSRADFGRAYLTERWASIFLSQLFTRFTVILIGYRLEDPILKYLVDALAADKEAKQVFAFTPFGDENTIDAVREDWDSKGVQALPYDKNNNHELLYHTLDKWAGYWSGGLGGKAGVIQDIGHQPPNVLTQEDIELFCHTLSEPDGSMIRKFQKYHAEFLDNELGESKKTEKIEQWYGWLERFITQGLIREEAIAGAFRFSPIELCPVERQICYWLAVFHLGNPKLLQRVMDRGGMLHPEFREIIRHELIYGDKWRDNTLFPFWFHLATDITSSISTDDFTGYATAPLLGDTPWNKGSSILFRNLMMTRLHMHPVWSFGSEQDENRKPVDGDVVLLHGDFKESWQKVTSRDDLEIIAPQLLQDATSALLRILDLLFLVGNAAPKEDLTYISRPSIADHPQNHNHDHWLVLIDILRDLHDLMDIKSPLVAEGCRKSWASIEFPVFKRLAIYGMTRTEHVDVNRKLDWLLEQEDWFWRVSVQHEVYELLKTAWAELDEAHQKRLIGYILDGPPRELFREDLDTDDWARIKDRETYDLFHCLQHHSTLPIEAINCLDDIQNKYPVWCPKEVERTGFSTWSESGFGWTSEHTAEALLAMPMDERVAILSSNERDHEGLVRQWNIAVKSSPKEAIKTLQVLASTGCYNEEIWKWAMFGFAELDGADSIWDQLIILLNTEMENLPENAVCAISRGIKNITPTASRDRLVQLLSLIERLLPIANKEAEFGEDHVHSAINHAGGHLVEALVDLLATRGLKVNQLIPSDLKSLFALVVSSQGDGFHLGRVILASRLYVLYSIDPVWVRDNLLPFFDWENPEAIGLWQGYLWAPRLPPDLFKELKSCYLKAFNYLDKFGAEKDNLAYLLGNIMADYDDAISSVEVHQAIFRLDDRGRGLVVSVFSDRLKAAGKKASRLWDEKLKSILSRFWPRKTEIQGEWLSRFMAQLTIYSGESFEDTVQTLLPFIGPSEQSGIVLEDLEKNNLAVEFPESTLKLISELISNDCRRRRIVDQELPTLLDAIKKAKPDLESNPSFIRLNELIIRGC